jgi:hypothetical protein
LRRGLYPTTASTTVTTVSPTVSPSQAPSVSPSEAPSVAPSQAPSASPTASPTVSPTTASPSVSHLGGGGVGRQVRPRALGAVAQKYCYHGSRPPTHSPRGTKATQPRSHALIHSCRERTHRLRCLLILLDAQSISPLSDTHLFGVGGQVRPRALEAVAQVALLREHHAHAHADAHDDGADAARHRRKHEPPLLVYRPVACVQRWEKLRIVT